LVTEVYEAGGVPELLLGNLAPSPVVVLDGEALVIAARSSDAQLRRSP